MSITFSCPGCSSKMTVPDHLAGKRGKCSKCKGAIVVPGGTPNGASASAKPAAVGSSKPTPPTAPPPAPEVDLEAEAAALLADAPKEEQNPQFVEFNCPQCDEPLKMALELAGKRAPCPECRRIIAVPIPKTATPADWRNAGPKLPAGARRDDGPAPEGAWGTGTGTVTRASNEALVEAGVIKEKEKPLTFYQKYQRVMLAAGAAVVVLSLGLGVWAWMTRNLERRALQTALAIGSAKNAEQVLGSGGQAVLFGYAGIYYLESQQSGCAKLAFEEYSKAASFGKSTQAADADALLTDLALAQLKLGGTTDIDTGRKLPWRDTHRLVQATLRGISSREARLQAIRRLSAALVEAGQLDYVQPTVDNLVPATGSERSEALAVAGLEMHRLEKQDLAESLLGEALSPYLPNKNDKNHKPPELNAAVVSLALLLGKTPPTPGKGLEEAESDARGRAFALARQGKLDEARAQVSKLPVADGAAMRGLIAVAEGAPSVETIEQALAAVAPERKRRDQDWPLLRLIELAAAAKLDSSKLEPAAAAIEDAGLSAWGRMLVLRAKLAASNSLVPEEAVGAISAKSIGGLVARLELARHNTRMSRSWASTVNSWDEAPRALGSLGVALGVQAAR